MGTKEDFVFCPSRVHQKRPLEDMPNNQKLLCVCVSLYVSLCVFLLRVSACVGVRRCANAVEKQMFLGTVGQKSRERVVAHCFLLRVVGQIHLMLDAFMTPKQTGGTPGAGL